LKVENHIYEAGVGVKQKRKSFACAAKPV